MNDLDMLYDEIFESKHGGKSLNKDGVLDTIKKNKKK